MSSCRNRMLPDCISNPTEQPRVQNAMSMICEVIPMFDAVVGPQASILSKKLLLRVPCPPSEAPPPASVYDLRLSLLVGVSARNRSNRGSHA